MTRITALFALVCLAAIPMSFAAAELTNKEAPVIVGHYHLNVSSVDARRCMGRVGHRVFFRRRWRLLLQASLRRRKRSPVDVTLLAGLGLFCWFVAGEEISWGQRLLAFQPPEFFLRENFQQELNLHNLLQNEKTLGIAIDSRHIVAFIALACGLKSMFTPATSAWSLSW